MTTKRDATFDAWVFLEFWPAALASLRLRPALAQLSAILDGAARAGFATRSE